MDQNKPPEKKMHTASTEADAKSVDGKSGQSNKSSHEASSHDAKSHTKAGENQGAGGGKKQERHH